MLMKQFYLTALQIQPEISALCAVYLNEMGR